MQPSLYLQGILCRSSTLGIIQHVAKTLPEKIEIDWSDAAQVDIDFIRDQTAIEQFSNCFQQYSSLIEPVS